MAKQIFKVDIDLEQNQLLQARVQNAGTEPLNPVVGQIYYDTGIDKMGVYTTNDGWLYFVMDDGSNPGYVTDVVTSNTAAISTSLDSSTGIVTLEIANATQMMDGLMSKEDKVKLDSATDDNIYNTLVERDGSGVISVSQITIANPPTASDHVATKEYVDGLVQGLKTKLPAKAIAETNISLSDLDPIDGYTPVDGDRILVAGQTDPIDNGIYIAQSGAWTRADDLKIGDSAANAYLFIEEGTVNADTGWVCTTNSPNDKVGTHGLTFVKFSSAGVIEAGQGLEKSGNSIHVRNNDGSIDVGTDDIAVKRDPDGGIGVDTNNGISVTPTPDGGINVDSTGVSVVGDSARAVTVGPNGVGVNVEGTDVIIDGNDEIALGNRVTKTVYSDVSLTANTAATITHGLGTQNVNVTVIDQYTGEQYFMNITHPNTNTVVVTSNSAVDVTVIISGAVGAVV